jgi:UDP-glucose:(heptosyl)LPS alpha-1,3-glucosyltransferase
MKSDQQPESVERSLASPCDVTVLAHDIGPVGGMERQLVELLIGLRRLGHHVTVIARTCDLPAGAGVDFHRVRGPGRPFVLAYPWFFVAGSLALRRLRRGIVQATGAIVLNRVDVIAIHYCHQIGPASPSRATGPFRAYVKVAGLLSRLAERLCFRANRSATFVCVSDGVADEMREHYPHARERVVTIHNGVNTAAFAPGVRAQEAAAMRTTLGISQQRLVAAFVGGEWERKGLGPALQALALAGEWDLVVAGDGDRVRYQELARSEGVADRVHWLGITREVQLVYQLADTLVFPTRYEAFPLVALEAAASGLAILATPVSGVRELVQDGHGGFLISREPHVIAERLRALGADPALRERMGAAAREAVLAFSWEKMVAAHHELYERLAARSGRAAPHSTISISEARSDP